MSSTTNTDTNSNINPSAAFGHINVKLWQNQDFVQEKSNPEDSPDVNSKLVDLVPGKFQIYVANSHILNPVGNVTSFTIEINGNRIMQLCVPQIQVTAERPYMVFLQSFPNPDSGKFEQLLAPKEVKEVRVTASLAKGGLQDVSEPGVTIDLQTRKTAWMVLELNAASDMHCVRSDGIATDDVSLIPTPKLEMLGPEIVYKFKVAKFESKGKSWEDLDEQDPKRRDPFVGESHYVT